MAFYGPTWNNANRVMPDSGKRKVNTAIYGTMRHDQEPSQEDKAEACVSALREHVDKLRTWKSIRRTRGLRLPLPACIYCRLMPASVRVRPCVRAQCRCALRCAQ